MTLAAAHIIAGLSVAAWVYLLLFHGRFWRVPRDPDEYPPLAGAWPVVVAVVPARNEIKTVAAAVRSLLMQDYPGEFAVVAVDDQSNDGTRPILEQMADDIAEGRFEGAHRPLAVVRGRKREPGWTGKLWALQQGLELAEARFPDAELFWLTDADIVHGPSNLRRFVARAEADGLGLASQMVRLRCRAPVERLLIPAFVFFFRKLYPFHWVNRPDRRTAAAAGGGLLIRETVLRRAGGLAEIRDQVIDDCALARLAKPIAPIRLDLTADAHSIRDYPRLAHIWAMVTRSAFVQLRHSYGLLALTILGMAILYLVPPAALAAGLIGGWPWLAGLGAAAWLPMALAYAPMLRFYGLSRLRSLLLPAAALLYAAMTVDSAWKHLTRRGLEWKGRRYPDGAA